MRPSYSLRLVRFVAAVALLGSCVDQAPNVPPTAAFTVACIDVTCRLTDGSTDADGTIDTYSWDFGDGGRSTTRDPVYVYAAPGGQFTIRLTVTDDDGAAATTTRSVAVPGNAPPIADFSFTCTHLTCTFTDRSQDPNAGDSVATRAWAFGDGDTSTEQNPTHSYAEPGGQFTVTLTVTDTKAASATESRLINVVPDPALDPVGTYERQTPHSDPGRHSRYVIRADSTFALLVWTGVDTATYPGRWRSACCWVGWDLVPGSVLILDFEAFTPTICGEGFGSFLVDGYVGIAYCGPQIAAGLEEGVYTSAPISTTPGPPPPQSGQIAFERDGRIHLANTDGSGVVPISAGPMDVGPVWSRDGSRIAFTRGNGATGAIVIMDADGGNVVQVAPLGIDPSWSADGAWLAYNCYALCVVKVDGTAGPDTIYNETGYTDYPAWSPDGTRIAFTSDRRAYDFSWDTWAVAPSGGTPTLLTTRSLADPMPYASYQPAWSPDAQRIAFVSCPWAWTACSTSALSVQRVGQPGAVHLVIGIANRYARPTWSPDGQVIAYASANAIEWVSADGQQRGRILDNGRDPAWRP